MLEKNLVWNGGVETSKIIRLCVQNCGHKMEVECVAICDTDCVRPRHMALWVWDEKKNTKYVWNGVHVYHQP